MDQNTVEGTRMPFSMKMGLVAMMAIAVCSGAVHAQSAGSTDPTAQSSGTTSTDPGAAAPTDPGTTVSTDPGLAASTASGTASSTGFGTTASSEPGTAASTSTTAVPSVDPALALNSNYQYGVFREVVVTATVSQRNCWVQGLVGGQTINGDLLTERVTLTQAQCVLNYMTRRGLCANQRTSAYWSARQDDTSNSVSNNWNKQAGPNDSQSTGASQGDGGWQVHRHSRNNGAWQNDGDPGNGGQWTRQGEWIQNGGVDPAWINRICGGGTTVSGSTTGTGAGTSSGTTSN
jgi:hypothetical protein